MVKNNMRIRGFTLVELMIVVAVIALLAAIAVPNILRARLTGNEVAAISSLKTICAAATSFRSPAGTYPVDLVALSNPNPPYIDVVLANGVKQGYNFALTGGANVFTATARPQVYQTTGTRSFFVDTSGVIHWTDQNAEATAADAELQ